MNDVIMYGSILIAVIIVVIMLIKKMNVKVTLFAMGVVLIYIAVAMGNPAAVKGFESTGLAVPDPLRAIIDQFKSTLPAAGFIILILGGYSAYMMNIDVNEATIYTLAKPIKKVKSVCVLVPPVFLTENVLSLVIPSTSNLAIILLATLYPVLRQASMSPLAAAAIIATTATVVPTPLSGNSVAVATRPAKYPTFAGMSVTDYVTRYHTAISVPILIVMAVVHPFWQKFMDKKSTGGLEDNVEVREIGAIPEDGLCHFVYTLLPTFPILLPIVIYIIHNVIGGNIDINVGVAFLLSFLIAIVCEIIRTEDNRKVLKQTEDFFKGVEGPMPIVALLAAANILILDLNSIDLIDALQTAMLGVQGLGMGFVLPSILMGLTILVVLLGGSGTALFYAMVPLMVPLAKATGISAIAVSTPVELCGNLMHAISPVAAVVVVVAGTIKANLLDIAKRTSVPVIASVITMFVLPMITFL